MKIHIYIILSLIIISCQDEKRYNIVVEKTIQNFTLSDLHTNMINIEKNEKGKVFFTLDPECPLCKSYSKKMNKIHAEYDSIIDFYGVFPSTVFNSKQVNQFMTQNDIKMPVIVDTNQILTNFLDANVTPECFLLDSNLNILYSGLIDDWIKELGRKRKNINNKYLEESLSLYLNNQEIIIQETKAIGCIIER